jgi:hypothetical protein
MRPFLDETLIAMAGQREWLVPHRGLRSAERVMTELGEAGFAIRSQRPVIQQDARKPMLMQVRAGPKLT